jgi:hypothetical protein
VPLAIAHVFIDVPVVAVVDEPVVPVAAFVVVVELVPLVADFVDDVPVEALEELPVPPEPDLSLRRS